MKLYLLSCETIQAYAERILPLLPEQRRRAFARSSSSMTLGAGLLLSSLLGVHRDEDLIYNPQGKPSLASRKPEFSLSHSRDRVLLGISENPIGVDMEHKARAVTLALRNRICLSQERALDPLLVFTRKECAMKLTGLGFGLPLDKIDTTDSFLWEGQLYRFFSTEEDGYMISVLTSEGELPTIQRLTPEELL